MNKVLYISHKAQCPKWRLLLSHFSCIRLFATPWTVAHQAPLSMELQARILEWGAISFSRASS